MENSQPILVTITAPTASGKSYLLNYIRDEAKLPCLVSTTTRKPRQGEKEGVDYYFISEEKSKEIESLDGFAELAVYRGIRYGVTKEEFSSKLGTGLTFLIVEPSGIDHYVKPALDVGAAHIKYYIHTELQTRIERFKNRIISDMYGELRNHPVSSIASLPLSSAQSVINGHVDRLVAMLTEEQHWFTSSRWDRILFGDKSPKENLEIILQDIEKRKNRYSQVKN